MALHFIVVVPVFTPYAKMITAIAISYVLMEPLHDFTPHNLKYANVDPAPRTLVTLMKQGADHEIHQTLVESCHSTFFSGHRR
jgi:hypothetical protein